jgi:hypothetical protein
MTPRAMDDSTGLSKKAKTSMNRELKIKNAGNIGYPGTLNTD